MSGLTEPTERLRWRDAANKVRLLLEKEVKAIDQAFKDDAERNGGLVVGNTEWVLEPQWVDQVDLLALHEALGDRFYRVVSTSKTAVEREVKKDSPDVLAAARACIERVPVGTKVTKKEVEQ